jgi:hypothetical protein
MQLLRLRGDQILGKNFYRAMIAHAFPALAGIPNASTGLPVTDEPARPVWQPTSIDDLYSRFPEFMQRLAHVTIGRLRRRAKSTSDSVESSHWSLVLDKAVQSKTISVGSITVTAEPSSDLHLRAVVLGLQWTVEYLKEGVARLGAW